MKKTLTVAMVILVLIASSFFSGPAGAGGVSVGTLSAVAVVPSTLSLDITILDAAGSQASSFGKMCRLSRETAATKRFRKLLFRDPTGSSRTISLAYSMASGVPSDLPSGAYAGTLQFTLVST